MADTPLPPILFDLDGTLIDSRASVDRVWSRWARRHDLEPDRILPFVYGHRSVETIAHFAPHLDASAEACAVDAAQAVDTEGVTADAAAADLLAALPSTRWAIVTSCTRALAIARLRAAGLPVPRVLVCSDDVAAGKPRPDGYLAAAARLAFEPSQCVAVEDAATGVEAARSAGMSVIALTTTHAAQQLARAHVVIGSLSELAPALRRLQRSEP